MKAEINQYYNEIAENYDSSRFSNSYGKYINNQENRILKKYLDQEDVSLNLDVACGTGRFLKYADHGVDISSEMIRISKNRFPSKDIIIGDAEELPYKNEHFENVISFHLFMHLDLTTTEKILSEVGRVTKKEGFFIFDIPSLKRRKISGYQSKSWHGGNQIQVEKLKKITSKDWNMECFYGIAFFPIHRIPKKIRKFFILIDNFLCESFLKEYSSHLIFVLRRK
ncbi:class I SAM-dependent methyltransferase [uncultured Aquimarina sp.]|uniref:class I SAM-dependent methyltransferase n=1 Tax=uncultured Aquimarina sp. TaxID=575652 RepID=UPI00261CC89E|nr:class I SAM-dependent methyltransferase [uncultured Aquimarina sp.]